MTFGPIGWSHRRESTGQTRRLLHRNQAVWASLVTNAVGAAGHGVELAGRKSVRVKILVKPKKKDFVVLPQ